MTRADAHVHLSTHHPFSAALDDGGEVEAYLRMREAAGISHSLVIGYERDVHAGNNDDIRRIARTVDGLHTTAFLETRGRPDPRALGDALADGHVGWSIYLDADGLDHWNASDLAALGALTDGLVSVNAASDDAPRLREFADACGDVPILVSHLGLPGSRPIESALGPLTELADDPRLHVKVSGLYAIDRRPDHPAARGAVERVARDFGAERMLWGSDFSPVLDSGADPVALPSWLADVLGADLDRVLGSNLLGLLGVASQ